MTTKTHKTNEFFFLGFSAMIATQLLLVDEILRAGKKQ
jgi:hypothetical protein